MSTLFYLVGFALVWYGYYFAIVRSFRSDGGGSIGNDDILVAAILSATLALLWPVTCIGLIAAFLYRHSRGERLVDRIRHWTEHKIASKD
jgi:hypothetical protein